MNRPQKTPPTTPKEVVKPRQPEPAAPVVEEAKFAEEPSVDQPKFAEDVEVGKPQYADVAVEEPQYAEEKSATVDAPQYVEQVVQVEEPKFVEETATVEEPQFVEEGPTVEEPQYSEESSEYTEDVAVVEEVQYTEETPATEQSEEEERKEKRELAVKELIDTEAAYYQDLMVITSIFLDPMKNNDKISKLLTPTQFRDIFSNFEVIPKLHSDILCQLLLPDCKVADSFLQYVAYFRMYVMYCNNLDKQDATVNGLLSSSPAFAAFAAECKRRPECRSLDMLAFLIKPLQRICKYPLLFREIIKYSPPDDLETKRLKEVEDQLQQVLTKINTQKRMVDTSSKALDLQERLTNKHGTVPALISPARRFLRHGFVTEIDLSTKKIKEIQYILCSDMLVRVNKKVGNSQLEVITMTHLDSVGFLPVDNTFPFPKLGWKWSSLKPENSLELFIHMPNQEVPIHVLACFSNDSDLQDWSTDFEEAKKNLVNLDGMLPVAV